MTLAMQNYGINNNKKKYRHLDNKIVTLNKHKTKRFYIINNTYIGLHVNYFLSSLLFLILNFK